MAIATPTNLKTLCFFDKGKLCTTIAANGVFLPGSMQMVNRGTPLIIIEEAESEPEGPVYANHEINGTPLLQVAETIGGILSGTSEINGVVLTT